MIQKLRISSYKDYIAIDFTNEDGLIKNTPFYIGKNKKVEVHWAIPSNERTDYPTTYDEWWERYMFKFDGEKLECKWLNGPKGNQSTYSEVKLEELIDWRFQYAHKIINK